MFVCLFSLLISLFLSLSFLSLFPLFPSFPFFPSFLSSLSLLPFLFFPFSFSSYFFFPCFLSSFLLFLVFCCCSSSSKGCVSLLLLLPIILVFVAAIMIFVFVYFSAFVVVVFLYCHAVKLGKAKKQKEKNTPKKWKYFPVFLQDKLLLHVQKLSVFCSVLLFFALLLPKHYKIGFFNDFEKLIFRLLVNISRSITWPHFGPKCWPKMWPSYWPWSFHMFFVKALIFWKISFSLQKEEYFWKKLWNKGGQVIDLWWPSYWPYSIYIYIYIYIHTGCWPKNESLYPIKNLLLT